MKDPIIAPPRADPAPAVPPPSISQRDATAADLPALERLFHDSFTATFGHLYRPADLAAFLGGYGPERWRAVLADRETVLRLAVSGGAITGFANLGNLTMDVDAPHPSAELRQLYVADHAKGTGVGPALMGWAIASARARGARALFLGVYVENHRARRFYDRYGFVDVGRHDFPIGEQIDEDRILKLTL